MPDDKALARSRVAVRELAIVLADAAERIRRDVMIDRVPDTSTAAELMAALIEQAAEYARLHAQHHPR